MNIALSSTGNSSTVLSCVHPYLERDPALRAHGEWVGIGLGVTTHAPRVELDDGPRGDNATVVKNLRLRKLAENDMHTVTNSMLHRSSHTYCTGTS